jgi:hypothetical protein
MELITYPARPMAGGRLGLVPKPNVHLWSAKLNGWPAYFTIPAASVSVPLRWLVTCFSSQTRPVKRVFFDSGTHSPLPPLFLRAGDSTRVTYPVLNALATCAKMF